MPIYSVDDAVECYESVPSSATNQELMVRVLSAHASKFAAGYFEFLLLSPVPFTPFPNIRGIVEFLVKICACDQIWITEHSRVPGKEHRAR